MKSFFKKLWAAFLSVLLAITIIPFGAVTGYAAPAGDFTPYFTNVKITAADGTALPVIVAKNASIKVEFDYAVPAGGLAVDSYSFKLPLEIAEGAPTAAIIDSSLTIADITCSANGDAEIAFTQAAFDNGYLAQGSGGSFNFLVSLNKDNISNSKKDITFFPGSSNEKKINMAFALDQISGICITTVEVKALNASNNKITWSITSKPELRNANAGIPNENKITNFKIESNLTAGLELSGTPVFKLNGTPLNIVDYDFTAEGTPDTGLKLTFALKPGYNYLYNPSDQFQIEYDSVYSMKAFENSEKAKFENKTKAGFSCERYKQDSATGAISLDDAKQPVNSNQNDANAEIASGILKKEYTYNKATQTIKWHITVNEDYFIFDDASVNIKDTIPAGLKLVPMSVKKSVDNNNWSDARYSYAPTGFEGGTLETTEFTMNDKVYITYETVINPAIWQKEPSHEFINNVIFKTEHNAIQHTFTRTSSLNAVFAGAGGGLIGASGAYNRQNHTFTWETAVNSSNAAVNSGVVTLFIPDGITYVDGSITYSGAALGSSAGAPTPVVGGKSLKVSLPSSINAEGKISIKTTVDNPKLWATNNADTPYSIKANLVSGDIDLTAQASANAVTKVIEKSSADANGYDFNTKELKWKIDINQNQMAMTNPVITDVLPAGLSYKASSVTANGIAILPNGVSYDDATRTLTVSLADAVIGDAAPYIEFVAIVNDDSYLKLPSKSIINTASIYFDELGAEGAVSHTHSRTIGRPPLTKTGKQNQSYRNYTWSVEINPNQADLGALTLSDTLPSGLVMDLESVKLHEANTAQYTGALTSSGTLVYDGKSPALYPDFTAELSGQTFTFKFNSGLSKAYILTFDTDNTNNSAAKYKNSIMFEGDLPSATTTDDISQGNALSGGTANPNRGTIKINSKAGAVGNANLAGVVYKITGTNKNNVYTATTDAAGIATFTPVKFDTYSVEVLFIPNGYGALSGTTDITISGAARSQSLTLRYDTGTLVTVSYNGNGYTGGAQPPALKYAPNATGVKAVPNTFVRAGATFLKWNTAPDASGADYSPADIIAIGSSDITLYAIWTALPDNGGSPGTPVNPESPGSGTVILAPKPNPQTGVK